MDSAVVTALLWATLVASLSATVYGLARRSWPRLLVAALLSLTFSLTAFSLGLLTLLLTCLQLAAALALRRSAGARGWTILLLLGAFAWAVGVLVPLWLDPLTAWLPTITLAMIAIGIVLTIVGPGASHGPRPGEAS